VALAAEAAGAYGITVHLREDRRHVQDSDVFTLRQAIRTRLNLEMANIPEILAVALDVRPDEVCLVPERRQEVTTEGGLDVAGQASALTPTVARLKDAGIKVSLFVAPDEKQIIAASRVGAEIVELHTGAFAEASEEDCSLEVERLTAGAVLAHSLKLQVNAGHGLNYTNIRQIFDVPHLADLNIGHSIMCRAMMVGMGQAVSEMIKLMAGYGEKGYSEGRAENEQGA
jgi:pyridoxine 5-phosphate synthase